MHSSFRIALVAAGLAVAALAVHAPSAEAQGRQITRLHMGSGSFLGVVLEDVGADDVKAMKLPAEAGAHVTAVEKDSPAAEAGIEQGDVIVRFAGESVRSAAQLTRLVRETPVGRAVAVEVSRAGAAKTLSATIGQMPGPQRWAADMTRRLRQHMPELLDVPEDGPDAEGGEEMEAPDAPELGDAPRWRDLEGSRLLLRSRGPRVGIGLLPLTDQLAEHLKVDGGVLVSEVHEDSPAQKAGIQAGDVVVEFDGQKVGDPGDLVRAVAQAEPGSEVSVKLQRDGKPVEVKVKLAEREERGRGGRDRGGANRDRPAGREAGSGVKT